MSKRTISRVFLLSICCSTREPDPGIKEGVCAIIYAAQRTEVKGNTRRHFSHHQLNSNNRLLARTSCSA